MGQLTFLEAIRTDIRYAITAIKQKNPTSIGTAISFDYQKIVTKD